MSKEQRKLGMKFVRCVLGMFCVGLVVGCAQQQQQNMPLYDNITVVDELVIDENSVPIFPKKAALTTDTARRFSVELPMRDRTAYCCGS